MASLLPVLDVETSIHLGSPIRILELKATSNAWRGMAE